MHLPNFLYSRKFDTKWSGLKVRKSDGNLLLHFLQLRSAFESGRTSRYQKMIHVRDGQIVESLNKTRFNIRWLTIQSGIHVGWGYGHFERTCRLCIAREKAICVQYVCRMCSQHTKNAFTWTSVNNSWSVSIKIKLILYIDLLQWMKFTITHPAVSHNSGQDSLFTPKKAKSIPSAGNVIGVLGR